MLPLEVEEVAIEIVLVVCAAGRVVRGAVALPHVVIGLAALPAPRLLALRRAR